MDLRASIRLACFCVCLGCQAVLSPAFNIIVTMGSYRGLVHFLNSLRTRMNLAFASSESSHSDKYKNIEVMLKKNI